jgi:hypothetical protein
MPVRHGTGVGQPNVQSAARAALAMDPPTWLHRVPVSQPHGAAAAEREAAPGDSGVDGSRRSLGVTWGEVRIAVWLSVVCAVSAALLAVPAGAAVFLVDDQVWKTFGNGTDRFAAFRDVTRMERREPFTLDFERGSPSARGHHILASGWGLAIGLLIFPVCYVAYLGASLNVCCSALGSAALAFTVMSMGFFLTETDAFLNYSPGLGFALLLGTLKIVCPRNSKVPTQAIKQALVFMVGNVLVMNVIPESVVCTCSRTTTQTPSELMTNWPWPIRCTVSQDLTRFLQTFLLLNLYKEIGRYFMVSAAYYLTVADLKNSGVAVNRDAAVVPVVMYQTFMSIVFRLEVSNYDDLKVALATCLLQGVLEIVLRLTA